MAKLIIKAANGSVADFRVDAQLEWTVHDLKSHLYRYYPSHPPLQSQKLIHSGRLLMEHETVREIVPERGDNPLVIHLVAYERSSSLPAVTTSRNVSRQASRQPSVPPLEETDAEHSTSPPAQPERQNQAPPPAPPTSATPTTATPTTATPTTSPAQHSQTDPWLRYRGLHGFQAQGIPPAAHLVQNFAPGMAGYPVPPFYMSPYGAAYAVNAAQMAQWYNYYARPPPGAPVAAADPSVEDLDLEQPDNAQEPPNNNNQDVEEDMPMNAAGGLGMMAGGNPQRQRDVVDHMYMLMMAGFLLAVAYITGSVGRLLIFAAGVLFMLLNQAGWFSLRRVRPAEQPNPQPNPGAEEPQEEQAGEREAGEAPQREGGEATEGRDNTQTETDGPDNNNDDLNSSQTPEQRLVPEPPREPERPGLLATIFVFITSFFTSLLPQQPPELQMN